MSIVHTGGGIATGSKNRYSLDNIMSFIRSLTHAIVSINKDRELNPNLERNRRVPLSRLEGKKKNESGPSNSF